MLNQSGAKKIIDGLKLEVLDSENKVKAMEDKMF